MMAPRQERATRRIARELRRAGCTMGSLDYLEDVVRGTLELIAEMVASDGSIRLPSLGSFHAVDVPAKERYNPATGRKEIQGPHVRVAFRPAVPFKRAVNGEDCTTNPPECP